MSGPAPVERDSRGILDPWLLRQRVALTRYPPTPALEGLIDRFWAVRWDLPAGANHRQEVLTHPSVNLSVGTPDARGDGRATEARVTGVGTDLVDRELAGRGWTVAAMSTVGGFGAFVEGSVADLVDRSVEVDVVPGLDGRALVAALDGDGDDPAALERSRVDALADALAAVVARADPDRVAQAREVAAVARLAETDRTVRRLDDLAALAGVGPRALQRTFTRHAGVSPTWVVRRYRLLDAAEAVRGGARVAWSDVATDLGYADQAHLVRDFRAALGRTPEAYARSART